MFDKYIFSFISFSRLFFRATPIFLLFIVLTACSTKGYLPYPEPVGQMLSEQASEDILRGLREQPLPNTAKFFLNVGLRYGPDFNSFRQGIIYQEPHNFRVETYPLQAAWASNYFISNGQEFIYYDSQNNEEEKGEFATDLFEKYYQIPVSFEEILSLLIGRTPQKWLEQDDLVIYAKDQSFFCFTKDQKYFWNLDSQKLLKDFVIYQEGSEQVILKGVVLSYAKKNNQLLPNIIQLEIPRHEVKVNLRVSQGEINQQIASNIFVID